MTLTMIIPDLTEHPPGELPDQPNLGSLQLRIVLEGSKPEIWRRLIVPANANLGWIHAVIQLAMGWTNSHLHQFRRGDQVVSDPKFELESFESEPPILDERLVVLGEFLATPGEALIYEYDFGDSWNHLVSVENLLEPQLAVAGKAVCIGGARACPPEDCGGLGGYEELLKALRNKKHRDHKAMTEWLGRPFDGEHFDTEDTNRWLSKLGWPRTTEAALRKVLVARDRAGG